MKFFLILLFICFYMTIRTTVDARTVRLRKASWLSPNHGDYPVDSFRPRFEQRRQAGWGKRRNIALEDDDEDLPAYHPYAFHDSSARIWFDEK